MYYKQILKALFKAVILQHSRDFQAEYSGRYESISEPVLNFIILTIFFPTLCKYWPISREPKNIAMHYKQILKALFTAVILRYSRDFQLEYSGSYDPNSEMIFNFVDYFFRARGREQSISQKLGAIAGQCKQILKALFQTVVLRPTRAPYLYWFRFGVQFTFEIF